MITPLDTEKIKSRLLISGFTEMASAVYAFVIGTHSNSNLIGYDLAFPTDNTATVMIYTDSKEAHEFVGLKKGNRVGLDYKIYMDYKTQDLGVKVAILEGVYR